MMLFPVGVASADSCLTPSGQVLESSSPRALGKLAETKYTPYSWNNTLSQKFPHSLQQRGKSKDTRLSEEEPPSFGKGEGTGPTEVWKAKQK